VPLLQSRAAPSAAGGWRESGRATATVRAFATQSTTDAGYELLKKDFRRWLRKEAQVLSLIMLAGITGVYFYKSAKKNDREGALKHCLHAYSITKATNSQDRHLFELAFAIAAQFETLGKGNQATVYYQEALGNIPYVRDAAARDLNRVVTLDRIAQCYQDKGEQVTAEKYYKQAVSVYDTSRSSRATDSAPDAQLTVDHEIPAVLFNYGQQLMHLKRWDEGAYYLRRALTLAQGDSASVSEENIAKIESMLQSISSEMDGVKDEDEY
uniref:Tetratricopeptide repeat-like domain-containing protein n=1 Tax=Globisporangium ultimum (strain ATCC 200006 / CBS 805.95 / DAOM BR144) TaxID=431595 RepID=K3WNV4_GLOUD